jgi:hypothetical protein
MAVTSFIHAGGTVTFARTPQRPDGQVEIMQPSRITPARRRFGYSPTVTLSPFTLELRATTAEKDAVVAFFYNNAKGMSNPFEYQKPDGTTTIVRFASPKIRTRELVAGSWIVTVDLVELL